MQRTTIVAGDTLRVIVAQPDYPATAGWSLHYRLVPQAGSAAVISLTATASGDGHEISAAAATTALWSAGAYAWTSWVQRGAESHSVGRGQISIQPDPRTLAAGYDGRTPVRKALEAADAALASYGSKAWTQSYSIGGRSVTFRSPDEFMAWRSRLRAEVQREDAASGQVGAGNRRKLFVRVQRA